MVDMRKPLMRYKTCYNSTHPGGKDVKNNEEWTLSQG